MKKGAGFLLKTILLLGILVGLDQITGRLLEHFFFRNSTPEYAPVTYAVEKANQEIVVFGSSRATHHYVSNLIAARLRQSCYNAGKDGHFTFYQYGLLKSILHRYAPKTIILDLNSLDFEIEKTEDVFPLLPYYATHPELQTVIDRSDRWQRYRMLSRKYRFNSLPLSIAAANYHPKIVRDTASGYIPLFGEWKKNLASDVTKHRTLDEETIEVFRSFLKESHAAGSKVYVFVSPRFYESSERNPDFSLGKKICEEMKVPFYDLSNVMNGQPDFFSDREHLNDEGARAFTERVIAVLKEP